MAQNPSNIHIGAARIFLGVTPPATGNPPTLLAHVDGVPTTGIEVGYTQDAATFTYKQNKQEVEAEQSLNPVDVFIVNEEIQIEFNAMEHVYSSLRTAFDNVGSINDVDKMLFYGGDGAGLVSVGTQCVALTSRIRTSPTKHEVLVLYRVYNMEGVSIPYNRTGVALYKITLKGLVDTTRVAGDRLFQWFREKGILAETAVAGIPGTFTPTGAVAPTNLPSMTSVLASPTSVWTVGQYVALGDTSHVYWNGIAWVAGESTGASTGATAGTPGTFTPAGSVIPPNFGAITGVVASPSGAWTPGKYVQLGDGSKASWNGTAWVVGAVATGATAGTPGTFTPSGSAAPGTLAAAATVIAAPTTAWTAGQSVVLGDASAMHWTLTPSPQWAVGVGTGTLLMADAAKSGEKNGGTAPPAEPKK